MRRARNSSPVARSWCRCSVTHGKLTPEVLSGAIDKHPANVHTVQPAVVSLTQATELGTAYRPDEIAAISKLAHERGLTVQMDGARFANAVAFLGLPSR